MANKLVVRRVTGVLCILTVCLGLLVGGQQFGMAVTGTWTAVSSAVAKGLGLEGIAPADRDSFALNPKDSPFEAMGDGVTDDTAALQAWLNAGGVRLADGTYRISRGLTLAGDNRHFLATNAKILAVGTNITALTVTGKNTTIRANIDGNNKAAFGLKVTGAGAVVEDGRYENFRSANQSARAIDVTTTGGVTVRNNVVRNVVSIGDNRIGNGPGFARGIGLNARSAATAVSVISSNRIENIAGEEGDAIHVLFVDGRLPFESGKVSIRDNQIRNVSRRFIKVQASDVVVERNRLSFDLAEVPANPSSAIDVIQSDYVQVIGNQINPNLVGSGIAVNGSSTAPLRGIEIRGNVVRQKATKKAASIYLKWTRSPNIVNNAVYGGGAAVLIGSSTNAHVSGNTHGRGVSSSP